MEILYLLLFALGGVGTIGFLLYATGALKDAAITDTPRVQQLIQNELPDFQASEIVLSADLKTSVAAEKSGSSIALIYCLGDKLIVRELKGGDLIGSRLSGGTGDTPLTLEIEVADFARPKFDIVLHPPSKGGEVMSAQRAQRAQDIGNAWNERIRKMIGTKATLPALAMFPD